MTEIHIVRNTKLSKFRDLKVGIMFVSEHWPDNVFAVTAPTHGGNNAIRLGDVPVGSASYRFDPDFSVTVIDKATFEV
jgi:hypothetical protein